MKEKKIMGNRKKIISLGNFLAFLVMILTSGCASMAHKKELTAFNNLYSTGQYTEAANTEIKKKGEKKLDPSKLLQLLQAAAALRYAQQYQQSLLLFDECEDIIKHHNEQSMIYNASSNVGAILVNDAALDYRGAEYDGVMVNTYKALNFWQVGKINLARIEFNRALDRQRRAKERFAAEIAKLKEELEKKQEEENKKAQSKNKNALKININKNVNNHEIDTILKKKYSNLYEFKAYPDFINPFTTYIAGIFFMSEGNYSKAATLLKEAYGMVEKNTTIADDFANAEKMLDGQKNNKNYTWIIFENGLCPEKEEFRVDLPIFLFTDKAKYTGIALPKLKFRDQAYSHLIIKNSGHNVGHTSMLSSMDKVIQTEFKKKYKATVTRAVVSTLIKTYGQYLAQRKFGSLGGIAFGLYQLSTTAADVRMWTALPKEFQLAKINTPSNGILLLETPTGNIISVTVPKDNSSLVYIKIPTSRAKAVYDVIKM
jgi:uncharacterized protein